MSPEDKERINDIVIQAAEAVVRIDATYKQNRSKLVDHSKEFSVLELRSLVLRFNNETENNPKESEDLDALVNYMLMHSAIIVSRLEAEQESVGHDEPFVDAIIDATMQGWSAEHSFKTKAALAAKSAKGERVGGVPYGFEIDADGKRLVPIAYEQKIINRICFLAGDGRTLRAISETLSSEGHVSNSGRPFAPVQIARILTRSGISK